MNILIITHAPLSPKYGAAQAAINLSESLRGRNHRVTLWSPLPLLEKNGKLGKIRRVALMREKVNQYLALSKEKYDVVDAPPSLITIPLRQSADLLLARSVQPDIQYLLSHYRDLLKFNAKLLTHAALHTVSLPEKIKDVIMGWYLADNIFCLGSLELKWMQTYFPFWNQKFKSYMNALSKYDQQALTEIRFQRQVACESDQNCGISFLWIGRWVAHKGYQRLLQFIRQRAYNFPSDTFTIAGCGNITLPPDLDQLRLREQIKIIPQFERERLRSLLSDHQVGLFTSIVEGWGLSLNEMLESGMPVYATEAGGVPDLKAFFPEHLRPFPPAESARINATPNFNLGRYYDHSTWDATAQLIENLSGSPDILVCKV
ncbi:MAG: glycosyltransferase family 4 protein [Synechococcaceae cyanobacterium SM2_3_1]|nr:glycosyltransferase family 4 protein [Synechococcaceae cyanobacterium SM2_3_1]